VPWSHSTSIHTASTNTISQRPAVTVIPVAVVDGASGAESEERRQRGAVGALQAIEVSPLAWFVPCGCLSGGSCCSSDRLARLGRKGRSRCWALFASTATW